MRSRSILLFCFGLFSLAACSSTSSQASGQPGSAEEVQAPLPTIGLGSNPGQISGGADVRAIEPDAVESIVMIGDSITVGSTEALEEQFELLGFDTVTIVAQNNKRTAVSLRDNTSGSEIAAFIAQEVERPETQLWVVALGTNDISQYNDVEQMEAAVNEVLDPIPDNAPLIWINTYFDSRPQDTAEVNEAIERAIRARGNATVGRWSDVAPADGVLRRDGVHPGDDGAVIFASLVTTTVANFLQ